MPKRIHGLYFVEDKDVSDILSTSKIALVRLHQLARTRGILVSKEDSREDIIARIAQMPFGWRQLNELLEYTSTPERKDSQTVCKVESRCSAADIRKCLDALMDARSRTEQEIYSAPKQVGKKTLRIVVSYPEIDESKSRLAQRIVREAEIEIEEGPKGLLIRCTDRHRAKQIVKDFIARLNKIAPCEEITIDLSDVLIAKTRTEFFLEVMAGLPGFIRENVKSLRGSRLPASARKDPLDEEESNLAKEDFEASVRKIVLTGEKIDKSRQYKQLEESGFFISEASWLSRNDRKGVLVEFEIGFGNDESAKDFYYCVKRVYEADKHGEYPRSGKRPTGDRLKELTQILEQAVLLACDNARSKAPPGSVKVSKRKVGGVQGKPGSKAGAKKRKK